MARQYFDNSEDYLSALDSEDGKVVALSAKDGLKLSIRRNYMDASIVGEVFLDRCYVRGLKLPARPVVVDVGGYIGDFALFAVKCLNARLVVVCEPSPRNWELLKLNVAANHYEDRIEMVNKAVASQEYVMMNVDEPDRQQARVSAYGFSDALRTAIPAVTLTQLVTDHQLKEIDLLKIDCEGGEYEILLTTPTEVFKLISHLVFEFHEIEGYGAMLNAVKQRLHDEGFSLATRGCLISASRDEMRTNR
jgi:FkbM family methyltransferase